MNSSRSYWYLQLFNFSTNAILDCCHITKFLIDLTTVLMVLVLIANGKCK